MGEDVSNVFRISVLVFLPALVLAVFSAGAKADMYVVVKANWTGGILPELADLNGDDVNEIIATLNLNSNDTVSVWNGSGSMLDGWPVLAPSLISSYPAVDDINNDTKKEIVFGDSSGILYVYNANGTLLWLNDTCAVQGISGGSITSAPTLADINNDGFPEIIFSCNVGISPSLIYAFDYYGNPVPGWNSVRTYGDMTGSPTVADLDGDGKLEIAMVGGASSGSAFYVQTFHGNGTEYWLAYPDGILTTQIPPSYESPAIIDIDGDNDKEVLVTSYNGTSSEIYLINSSGAAENSWEMPCAAASETIAANVGGSAGIISYCNDTVYAWDGNGTLAWNYTVGSNQGAESEHYPAVGDVNNDMLSVILVPAGKNLLILSGSGPMLMKINSTFADYFRVKYPVFMIDYYLNTPAIGDVDGDGNNEIVLSAQSPALAGRGEIFVFSVVQRPNLILNLPLNQYIYNYNSAPFNFSAYDDIVGIDSMWYSLDAGQNVTNFSIVGGEWSGILGSLSDGWHNLTAWANDTAGNLSRTMVAFAVDTTPPEINLYEPQNVTYVSKTIPLNFSAYDTVSGVYPSGFLYSVDGGVNASVYDNTTFNVGSDVNHNLTLYAYDNAGNVNSSSVNFTVICQESWTPTTVWSACSGGTQTRTCTDNQECGTQTNRSSCEIQSCTAPPPPPPSGGSGGRGASGAYCGDGSVQKWLGETCEKNSDCDASYYVCSMCKCVLQCQENWSCSAWSACPENGKSTRICTDMSGCGKSVEKPSESQDCSYSAGAANLSVTRLLEISLFAGTLCGDDKCGDGESCDTCPVDCGQCSDSVAATDGRSGMAGLMTGALELTLYGLIIIAVITIIMLAAHFLRQERNGEDSWISYCCFLISNPIALPIPFG